LVCDTVPVIVILSVPLPPTAAPVPAVTLMIPSVTSMTVLSERLSTSDTDTPGISRVVSSSMRRILGGGSAGGSFTGLTVIATVSMSCATPSPVVTVRVSGPLKLRLPR